ncbi:Uncharacterised protein [Klebsiella oxytoca]|uniref:Uncharacterized protein n=1 Tax=Klebsiella oxytoca TaxID=571 RepID=A0A6N3FAC1_KLEOX|nr:Uncharacterised protein [Klebsiella oxytoca]
MPERRLSRRGKQAASGLFPRGRRDTPCPGYRFTAVCGSGSPNRCAASPPENSATLRSAPRGGAMRLVRATGSPPSAGLVARTDAQYRLREILPLCALLPGRRDALCPGYGFTAVCGSGSPDRCAASPPGNSATLRSAPGGGAMRLARATGSPPSAGLVARTDAQFCSPDKALAAIRETSSTAPFLRALCINHPVQPRHHDRHDHRDAQGHQANFTEYVGVYRQRL